jgi:hypothetical protein
MHEHVSLYCIWVVLYHLHHQLINVYLINVYHTFHMDFPQGERAQTHHAGPVRMVGANECRYSRDHRLNVPSEARRRSR